MLLLLCIIKSNFFAFVMKKTKGVKERMVLCQSVVQLQKLVSKFKAEGKSIGLVPTMGALHEGHTSLIKASAKENDVTIVSIFVNPTQFGANEDYANYPRTLEQDCKVAEIAGATVVFAPSNEELYPHQDMTWVEVTGDITKVLCGKTRPIHFRGVTTVVTKLFNLSQANRAYFGQKDAQQIEVLRRMVEELFFTVELRIMPIVREIDGLAKSSRNNYLSEEERKSAVILSKSLMLAKQAFIQGERRTTKILKIVKDSINSEQMSNIDYVEIYKIPGLEPVGVVIKDKVLLAIAVRLGTTRLIDNVILEVA